MCIKIVQDCPARHRQHRHRQHRCVLGAGQVGHRISCLDTCPNKSAIHPGPRKCCNLFLNVVSLNQVLRPDIGKLQLPFYNNPVLAVVTSDATHFYLLTSLNIYPKLV